MNLELNHDNAGFGYAIFRGERKLAIYTNSHFAGLYRNGVGIKEPLPTHQHTLHWTTPFMPLDEVEAVVAYCRKLPPCPPPV